MVGFGWLQCRRVRPVLWDYASERLSEGPMETVEQHLSGCSACRHELESLRSAQNFLSVCRAEEEPAPPSDWNALRQRLLTQSPAPLPETPGPRRKSRHTPAILRGTGLELKSVRAPWQMQLVTSMGGAFAALGIVAVGYGLLMHRQAVPAPQSRLMNNATTPGPLTLAAKPAKTEVVMTDANGTAQKSNTGAVEMVRNVVSILNNTRVEAETMASPSAPVMQTASSGVMETVGYRPNSASQPHPGASTRSSAKLASNRIPPKHASKNIAHNEEHGFRHYTPKPEDALPATDQTASRYSLEQVRPVGNDSDDPNNYVVGTVRPIAHEDDHDY